MEHQSNRYDGFSLQYAKLVAAREEAGIEHDPIMPQGARVTEIDIASSLVEIARAKDPEGTIAYQVADLSQPLPAYQNHFGLIASHLVLNDVYDYRGFLTTLGSVAKPRGHLVLSLNNPYSLVVRGRITNYFESGKAFPYRGMAEEGVKVHFYQRTLEEYLDACVGAGFQLQHLLDIPTSEGTFRRQSDTFLPVGYQFPFFMILSFRKP